MNAQDYFTPVHYEPPPPRPRARMPIWLLVTLVAVAGVVLMAYAFFAWVGISAKSGITSHLPPAQVKVGQALPWRVLQRTSVAVPGSTGTLGGLFVADFDGDGDDEVLRVQPARYSFLYELDGTKSRVPLHGFGFMMGGVAWDFDRDGRAEIVSETSLGDISKSIKQGVSDPEQMQFSQTLPVYNLQGQVVAMLPAVARMLEGLFCGDVDGDGFKELLAHEPDPNDKYGSKTIVAFGDSGREVWRVDDSGIDCLMGDVDGDGKAELISAHIRDRGIWALGMKQAPRQIGSWKSAGQPVCCADMNGDGRDEVVTDSPPGYLDAQDTSLHEFDTAANPYADMMGQAGFNACGEFDGDAKRELALSSRIQGFVMLFDASGACRYYEEFGDITWGIAKARAKGKDYLVVQLTDRLLVCP